MALRSVKPACAASRPHLSNRNGRVFPLLIGGLALVASLGIATADSQAASPIRETPVVRVVREASPSVINIHGQKTVRGYGTSGSSDYRQVNGMGTAVVIDPRGYLLTNFHVVEDVNEIRATLSDRRTATARLIAADRKSDLAILKIDIAQPLPVIKFGTSSDLMLGETVIAIGNAYGWEHTATLGIISQLHREVPVNEETEYRDLIQTSADINPGNSGGPLLNVYGELIGINAAVRVGAQGIAFAIPIDQAMETAADLCEEVAARRLSVGIDGESPWMEESGRHFTVTHVQPGSVSERSGIQPGERVVKVGDREIASRLDFALAFIEASAGDELEIVTEREGQAQQLALHLSTPLPADGSSSPANAANTTTQRIWAAMGLQVQSVPSTEFPKVASAGEGRYEGGLRVVAVRPGSSASQHGIEAGDILIGMHEWQTPTVNDLDYILRRPELTRTKTTKFYIVRGGEMYEGSIRLSQSQRRVNH